MSRKYTLTADSKIPSPASSSNSAIERDREQGEVRPGDVPAGDEERGGEHHRLEEEVHERGADRGQRQDLAREGHLVHEPRVADDRRVAPTKPVENRFHTRSPDSRKSGNAGMPAPRIRSKAT